jgi:hypothetical protein
MPALIVIVTHHYLVEAWSACQFSGWLLIVQSSTRLLYVCTMCC